MIDSCIRFLTSLRLTVVLLGMAIVLVFVGTLAEVRMGLYQAQAEIFRCFFVWWNLPGTQFKIPVFPGGWFVGLALVVNLVAAHIKRFQFSRKKTGIFLIHAGLIFLLVGQFFTEMFQVESTMRLPVGGTMNFTEDSRRHELAVIDVTDPAHQTVTAIPEALLVPGTELHPNGLPFALRVRDHFQNSQYAGPMETGGQRIQSTRGIGKMLSFVAVPEAKRMDDENCPTALVEVLDNGKSEGDWAVSYWMSSPRLHNLLETNGVGDLVGPTFSKPQTFTAAGRTYQLDLRSTRYYQPFSVTLLEFHHDFYAGTDIPNNFSSRIHLSDPTRGEDRDVLIHMNAPLRYRGQTFYQASFEPGDQVSVLQVVRNPASITPYAACTLVALGLIVQFLTHLFGFARKRAQQTAPASPRVRPGVPPLEPALARKGTNV